MNFSGRLIGLRTPFKRYIFWYQYMLQGVTLSPTSHHPAPTDEEDDDPMSTTEKLSFAVGAIVNAISNCCVGFYLNPFLLEVASLTPGIVSLMMFVGRGWDAVTTAGVGFAVAKYPGIKGWLYATAAPTSAAYFMMWFVFDMRQSYRAVYVFGMYMLMQLGTSAYHVPYTSLTVKMHPSSQQRDIATTWRMLAEILSVLVGAGAQGLILGFFTDSNDCSSCRTEGDSRAEKGYIIAAAVMATLMLVCGTLCPMGVKERVKALPQPEGKGSGGALKNAFKSKSFVMLTTAFFFIWLVVQGVQGNILLYAKYAVPTWKDKFQYLLFLFVFCATIGMPIWMIIMRKIGKRNSYMIGSVSFALLLHVMYWMPDDTPWWVGAIFCVFCGLSLSATYLLPWSMLPAVVDEAELLTGRRDEAIFYAFFVFFMKMGAGVALAGSAMALQVAGWEEPCCVDAIADVPCDCSNLATCMCDVQPDSIGTALRIVVGIVGPALVLVGVIFIYLFPITPAREVEIAEAMVSIKINRNKATENNRHSIAETHNMSYMGVPASLAELPNKRHTLPSSPGNPLLHQRKGGATGSKRPHSMGF